MHKSFLKGTENFMKNQLIQIPHSEWAICYGKGSS